MKLHIQLSAESFLHGQSVPVECVLERSAEQPLRMPDPELNDTETRYVLVGPGSGGPRTLSGADYSALRHRGMNPLSEYTEHPAHFRRAWQADLLSYTPPLPPGEYQLHAEFAVNGESAVSNRVHFRVEPARARAGGFGWFPLAGPRASWEGAWVQQGGSSDRLVVQQDLAENPRLVSRGLDVGACTRTAGTPMLAVRMRKPVLVEWRWLVWLDGATLHGLHVPLVAGDQPGGSLQATIEESKAWLVARPVQTEEDGLILCVAGERNGRPGVRSYTSEAAAEVRPGEWLELPFLPEPSDLVRIARDARGESAALILADRRTPLRTKLWRHDLGPNPTVGAWAAIADFPGELEAWSADDPAAGRLCVSLLLHDGPRWTCGTFPLDAPHPWKPEALQPLFQQSGGQSRPFAEGSVREAAVAAGLEAEAPLVLLFDAAGNLWGTPRTLPVTLHAVPLGHLAHGAQRLIPCVSREGRRFAGFLENEVGWHWERLFRSEPSTQSPRPDAPSGR